MLSARTQPTHYLLWYAIYLHQYPVPMTAGQAFFVSQFQLHNDPGESPVNVSLLLSASQNHANSKNWHGYSVAYEAGPAAFVPMLQFTLDNVGSKTTNSAPTCSDHAAMMAGFCVRSRESYLRSIKQAQNGLSVLMAWKKLSHHKMQSHSNGTQMAVRASTFAVYSTQG